jgi:probable phosphoglycerate mutase
MTRLLIVRHGETQWNRESRIQGHADSALTAQGIAQAQALGERLARERIDHLYSSDLGRALETARIIAARTGHGVRVEPRLRERNFGVGEGLTYGELDHEYPEVFSRVRETDPDYEIPGGESRRQHYERVGAAFEALARAHPGETLAVVCHGGVLAAFFRRIHGIAIAAPHPIPIPNAAFNAVAREGASWSVLAWGDTAHLEAAPAMP